jgi:hypothetical protein
MTWPHRAQQSHQRYAAAMGFTIFSALSAFEQSLNFAHPLGRTLLLVGWLWVYRSG